MSTATLIEPGSTGSSHIGAAHHRRRNALLTIGALLLCIGMAVSHALWGRHDAAAADELAQFQAAYEERCDRSAFPAADAARTRKLYLGSSMLQRVIAQQRTALETGAACDAVYHALQAADFPFLPATEPAAREATIKLQTPVADPQ
jgi:hypothetical protein